MVKSILRLLSVAVVVGVSTFGSNLAIATQGVIPSCQYMPLVNNPIISGVPNTTVCIDVPVNLSENHSVFNIDTQVTTDGTSTGAPAALRHMWMLGKAMQARVNAGRMDAANIQIIGVMHGSALSWALNDAWWQKQVDKRGRQLYPNGNPNKEWLEKIFALNNAGVNIQLEVCGVTMSGKGLTNADLYSSPNGKIHVNQGAIGRIIDLQQKGYAVMQEGWIDNDKHDDDD